MSPRRLYQKIKSIDWRYVPAVGIQRLRSYDLTHPYTIFLAKIIPFKKPATILLSYPRSGSSWIGKILSYSPDLAYLREPINEVFTEIYQQGALIDPYQDEVTLQRYTYLSDQVLSGISPYNFPWVIERLNDFSVFSRRHRSLLIKEVNPLAAGFFVKKYYPQIVLILRHPAAVADSFERVGWLQAESESDWEEFGFQYGMHMVQAIEAIKAGWYQVIKYEDFATDPQDQFEKLFSILGVRKPKEFDNIINNYCETVSDGSDPYNIRRSSINEVDKWSKNLPQSSIAAIMNGYRKTGLGYYSVN